MNHYIKYIWAFALVFMTGAAFAQNAQFSLTTSGDSHIYWPFGSSSVFSSKTGSYCCNNGSYGSTCPQGTNQWRVTNGTGCGYHTGGDMYAEDWQRNSGQETFRQPFYAPLSGTVKVARSVPTGYGKVVMIQSDQNSSFAFMVAHLDEYTVGEENYVSAGTLIGYVGQSGGQSVIHPHVVLYKGITSTAINNMKTYGATPPSSMAAPFYMDAVGGASGSGTNIALNATPYAYSSQYSAEYSPAKALDGSVNTKWVSNGSGTYSDMYLNLNGVYNINKFVLKHAGAGGEWSAMNTENYSIFYWNGSSWAQVLNHVNSSQQNITQHTVNITAQFVYVAIYDPGVDNYTRLPEWEIYGTSAGARAELKTPPAMKQEAGASLLTIFPNPVQDKLSVQWGGESMSHVKMEVINAMGQVVRSMQVNELSATQPQEVDVTDLKPGFYQLSVSNDEEKDVISFIIK